MIALTFSIHSPSIDIYRHIFAIISRLFSSISAHTWKITRITMQWQESSTKKKRNKIKHWVRFVRNVEGSAVSISWIIHRYSNSIDNSTIVFFKLTMFFFCIAGDQIITRLDSISLESLDTLGGLIALDAEVRNLFCSVELINHCEVNK